MKKFTIPDSSTQETWIPPEVSQAIGRKRWNHWVVTVDKTKENFKRMDFVNGTLVRTKKGKL